LCNIVYDHNVMKEGHTTSFGARVAQASVQFIDCVQHQG
jgi:hypothetical protein